MLKICFGLCTQVSGRIFSLIKDEQFSLWFYCLLPSDRFSIWCIQGSTSGSVCLSLCKYIYTHICHMHFIHLWHRSCREVYVFNSSAGGAGNRTHSPSFTSDPSRLVHRLWEKKGRKEITDVFFFCLLLNVVRVVDLKHVTHKCVVSLIPGDFFFLLLLSAVHLFTPSAAGECSISNGWKYPLKVAR